MKQMQQHKPNMFISPLQITLKKPKHFLRHWDMELSFPIALFFFCLFNSFTLFPFNMRLQSQAPRALYLVASLSFPAFFLLRRSLIPAALISPILPCSKVCTSLTPAASQGSHYITAGLPASSPGSRPRPLLATIHTVT